MSQSKTSRLVLPQYFLVAADQRRSRETLLRSGSAAGMCETRRCAPGRARDRSLPATLVAAQRPPVHQLREILREFPNQIRDESDVDEKHLSVVITNNAGSRYRELCVGRSNRP